MRIFAFVTTSLALSMLIHTSLVQSTTPEESVRTLVRRNPVMVFSKVRPPLSLSLKSFAAISRSPLAARCRHL